MPQEQNEAGLTEAEFTMNVQGHRARETNIWWQAQAKSTGSR
jgi:hypothetical protein